MTAAAPAPASFMSQLEAELAAGAKALETDIAGAAQFFGPVVTASAADLAQAALTAVLQQAPALISGQQKFSAATSAVVTSLGTAGKAVALADAQVAVQAAYNAISSIAHPAAPAA